VVYASRAVEQESEYGIVLLVNSVCPIIIEGLNLG